MEKEMLEMAAKLVNIEINNIIEQWAHAPESLKAYAIRYESVDDHGFKLQPTHSNVFYGFALNKFIQMAVTLGLSFYIGTAPNEDGILAPTLRIYY